MDEWQGQTQDNREPSMRARFALMLAEGLEQVEEKYILGSISAEDYQAELRDIDMKLAVIGFALLNRPKTPGNRV